jgi:hypothetical protein
MLPFPQSGNNPFLGVVLAFSPPFRHTRTSHLQIPQALYILLETSINDVRANLPQKCPCFTGKTAGTLVGIRRIFAEEVRQFIR